MAGISHEESEIAKRHASRPKEVGHDYEHDIGLMKKKSKTNLKLIETSEIEPWTLDSSN
jgi:hypothetical protein